MTQKRRFLPFLLSLILLLNGCSLVRNQDQSNGAPIHPDTINANDAKTTDSMEKVMDALTSDAFDGRMTGTEGNQRAADYLAAQYQLMGLKPFDEDYFHEYRQLIYNPSKTISNITLVLSDGKEETLENGKDYLQHFEGNHLEARGPIALSQEDKDISNKIYVTDDPNTIQLATILKAKAILFKDDTFSRMSFIMTDLDKSRTPLIRISPQLYERLKNGEAEEIIIHMDGESMEATCTNVVGVIPGIDHKKAVVLSAHFDHLGSAGDNVYRGAVDNASGVAVLLDIANKLAAAAKTESFGMDILISAFNGEEFVLVGSDAFADDILNQYDALYNINFDCLGKKEGGDLVITGDKALSYDIYKELEKFAKADGLLCKWQHRNGMTDYLSFLDNNVSAVSLGQEQLDGIHTPKDTSEVIDFAYLEKISHMMLEFLISNKDKVFTKESQ